MRYFLILSLIVAIIAAPLTVSAQTAGYYTPQVTLQYGQDNSFGGLSFKGVGSALVSCSGLGDTVASVITSAVDKVKGVVGGLISKGLDSITGGLFSSLFGGGSKPGDNASSPSYVKDTALENKSGCLDGIAYVLSQQVLQQITNRTLHWANTGFNGNPLYIKDIDSYLLSIRNEKVSSFLNGAQNSNPIFGNALRSVITQQVTGLNDGQIDVELNTPEAKAYTSFMSDFSNGGWDALLDPKNNPIGAFFNAADDLTDNINTQKTDTQNELQRNGGFLDMKTCVEYAPTGDTNAAIQSGLHDPVCLKYETVTPGSIVAQQVSSITNSPQRQAELATSFNEAVGSFFDALLNQLFSRGLSGINGQANPADIGLATGGPGSNTVIGSNGQVLAGINAGVGNINAIAAGSATVDISHPQLLRAVIQAQYDYMNRASDSRMVLDRLLPEMGQLDYCVPGPNPSWQDSLNDNLNTYITSATATQISSDSTISNSGLSLYDKVKLGTQPVKDRQLSIIGNPSAKSYLQGTVSDNLTQEFTTKFSRDAIGNAFAATTVGTTQQNYNRGEATDAYDEVADLPTFAQNATKQDQLYAQHIATAQQDIQQLTAINAQVLKIVTTAKARYVAQQKAAGTPVNQQCLDASYVIDNSAVTGVSRQESNVQSPLIQQTLNANKYFYSNL